MDYYGLALNSLNRFKEAARAIERALKIEPSNPDLPHLNNS